MHGLGPFIILHEPLKLLSTLRQLLFSSYSHLIFSLILFYIPDVPRADAPLLTVIS